MKKTIFTVATVFLSLVFLSCSDVFGGRETEGIAFTIPPLAPQSVVADARTSAGLSRGSAWSIYGFLFGEDADPGEIKNIDNGQFTPPSVGEAHSYKGLIQAVSRKDVDISRPQPLFFQRIKAKTKCFVCVLVTYTSSDKTEYTVFSGISPDSVLSHLGVNPSFTDNFYTPEKGENELSLTLKKNERAPVYFATRNGADGIDSSGYSKYSPEKSTPYKPTHFYWSDPANTTGALAAVKKLSADKTGVIILMDDIGGSGNQVNISTDDNDLDRSVDFDSIPGKRCKLKAQGFSVSYGKYLSFRNILIAAGSGSVSIGEDAELRLGGAVSLDTRTEIKFDLPPLSPSLSIGRIIVTSPLSGNVGKVSVTFADPATVDEMEDYLEDNPLVRDDTGSADVPACFGSEVTVSSLSNTFTAQWKRMSGNWWGLDDDD